MAEFSTMLDRPAAVRRLRQMLQHYPIVLVEGARQVGKSTLVGKLSGLELHSWVFDLFDDIGGARSDPSLFIQNLQFPAFLDEVHYSPQIFSALKRRVDREGAKGMVVLSGSQQFQAIRLVAESMAGRVGLMQLPPLTLREMEGRGEGTPLIADWITGWGTLPADRLTPLLTERCSAESRSTDAAPLWNLLFRGGMPATPALPAELLRNYFDSYVATYIERDLRAQGDVRSLAQFHSFVRLLASLSGQEFNPNQIGRELGIDRKSAESWLQIIEASFLWKTLPSYARNPTRRVVSKGKGVMTDTGLLSSLVQISSPETLAGHPLAGRIFESWAINEIDRLLRFTPTPPLFWHFRSYEGDEVDLILELDGTLYPVEFKLTAAPRARDAAPFARLRSTFPNERIGTGLVVCSVEQPTWLRTDVVAVPWWGVF